MYNVCFFFDAVVVIRVHFSLEGGRETRIREMHYRYPIYLKTFLILILMFYLGRGHILDFFFFFFQQVSGSGSLYV